MQSDDTRAVYVACKSSMVIRCYWCKAKTRKGERAVDHIVPLARKGMHASENLCIACTSCNQKKSSHLPEEFSGQGELFGRIS